MSEQPKDGQQIQLPPNELQQIDYVSHSWDARIPAGVTPDDVLAPAFWAHHALKMHPMDEIRARSEDGTWVGYYLVLDSSRTWAKVYCKALYKLTSADVALTQAASDDVAMFMAAHKVVFRHAFKWSVVRNSDGAILLENEQQKGVAQAWLEAHARNQVPAQKAPVTA